MANGTTTVEEEEFKPPLPERVGEERGSLTGLAQELVYTVDHKKLGLMYIGSGLLFFVVGGIMATLIRVQLFFPNNKFLEPDVFNLFFTMHGTAMIFLVAMPLIFGFANYLVPLMIGTSAFSYKRGPRIITDWNSQLTGKSQGSQSPNRLLTQRRNRNLIGAS